MKIGVLIRDAVLPNQHGRSRSASKLRLSVGPGDATRLLSELTGGESCGDFDELRPLMISRIGVQKAGHLPLLHIASDSAREEHAKKRATNYYGRPV